MSSWGGAFFPQKVVNATIPRGRGLLSSVSGQGYGGSEKVSNWLKIQNQERRLNGVWMQLLPTFPSDSNGPHSGATRLRNNRPVGENLHGCQLRSDGIWDLVCNHFPADRAGRLCQSVVNTHVAHFLLREGHSSRPLCHVHRGGEAAGAGRWQLGREVAARDQRNSFSMMSPI